ncbi:MAG: hypothetical protein GXP27_00665 [Planctomycetes bacterium]|nr:hypothetical protein [Planctomycetota bacterium]
MIVLALSVAAGPCTRAAAIDISDWQRVSPAVGENFIENSGFEKGSLNDAQKLWGNVEYWDKETRAECEVVQLENGNRALKIQFRAVGDGDGCVVNYRRLTETHRCVVFDTERYLYHSLRIKNMGHGRVWGQLISNQYAGISVTSPVYPGPGWHRSSRLAIFRPAVHEALVLIRIYIKGAEPGDVYYVDDYQVTVVSKEQAEAILKAEDEEDERTERLPPTKHKTSSDAMKPWSEIAAGMLNDEGASGDNILMDSSFELNPGICAVRFGAKWWSDGGTVRRADDAPHGRYVITGKAVSDAYRFQPGKPYTVSFYAKAAKGSRLEVRIVGADRKRLAYRKTFRGTGQWRRYHASFKTTKIPRATHNALVLRLAGEPDCQFDAVMLNAGGLRDYRPQPLELVTLIPRRKETSFVTLFFDGEAVPVVVGAQRARPDASRVIDAEVRVHDFWERCVRRIPVQLEMAAGQVSAHQEVLIRGLPRGAYRVFLQTGKTKSRSVAFGIVGRHLSQGSEICGGSHTTGMDFNCNFVKALGITWTRHHAAYWGRFLSADGGFQWDGEDHEVAQKAKNKNLRFWGSLFYPPDPWPGRLERRKYWIELPDGFLDQMEPFLTAAVRHFRGKIRYWECWNEPFAAGISDRQYLAMLKRFYRIVKAEAPEAEVVGISGFLEPGTFNSFVVPLLKAGAARYMDHLSYHGYFQQWPEENLFRPDYQSLAKCLDTIRTLLDKNGGRQVDIWDDEFSMWGSDWYLNERVPMSVTSSKFDYRQGAAWIAHYITIGYAHGVRHFGPHVFDHNVVFQDQRRMEYDACGFSYDYAVKPKAIAYAVACEKMQDAEFVRSKEDGDVLWFVFKKPKGTLAVIFARKGMKCAVTLRNATAWSFRNLFDGPLATVTTSGSKSVVRLVGEPVYAETRQPAEDVIEVLSTVRQEQ